ncbi:hypothetical protein AVV36_gp045 [Pectobacterium bacteriophage PM2]|uniref:Uncharacterized protein n=1 Tax=Pectobacterium bacteriophage PM2 TaxID=1429794 RepID=A0A0A0Q3B7_9CAUD|nr:hypothetical protein AVV36_gp045 [Pectobacterium bacteriophage PM2]AHY25007.1 hypothetical protein PM2_045 [Pectobacterium bacteriophage PM2]
MKNIEELKSDLKLLFETKADGLVPKETLSYFADAFAHSIMGTINLELERHINVGKRK